MNSPALAGFAWLLSLQVAGELLSRGLALPLPGPVVGMALLLALLGYPQVREPVRVVADVLLAHLSLLFVPVAVGVMSFLPLLGQHLFKLLVVLVLSAWIGLAATVGVLRRFPVRSDEPRR